jgi:hypothetical protein
MERGTAQRPMRNVVLLQAKIKLSGREYLVDVWSQRAVVVHRNERIKALGHIHSDGYYQLAGGSERLWKLGSEAVGHFQPDKETRT